MTLSYPKFQLTVRAALVVVAALGLGACSRSQHITDDVSGPRRQGAGTEIIAGCPTLTPNTLATADVVNVESASTPKNLPGRLRMELVGDIAVPSLQSMGPCAAADIPTISFTGGHANAVVSGTTNSITTTGNRLTFGALLFAGTNVEPGTVFATDSQGNVLQIIWPALAGIGVGSPRIRFQLAQWNTAMTPPGTTVDVSFDMTISQNGVTQNIKGSVAGLPLDGTAINPGGGGAVAPCPATLGASANTVPVLAQIPQFRARRLRVEVWGDAPSGVINAAGACAASDVPTIRFTGGSANMTRAGTDISVTATGSPLTFGPLLFPGALLEPGVVIATDAAGDMLQIIWPSLAGLPPGPPVLRLNQTRWNAWIQTGRAVDVSLRFDAVGPDGATASFTAVGKNIVVPQQR